MQEMSIFLLQKATESGLVAKAPAFDHGPPAPTSRQSSWTLPFG